MTNFGSSGVQDTIANLLASTATVQGYGEEAVTRDLQAVLAAHDMQVRDMFKFVEFSTDRQRVWGGNSQGNMVKLDQYGHAYSQKPLAGYNVGFPMTYWGYAVLFTRRFLARATVGEVFQRQLDAQAAHAREVVRELQRAIFDNDDYNFYDENVTPNAYVPVKRLLNADGETIPNGIAGQSFATTHDHYLAVSSSGTASTADILGLVDTVREHGHDAGLTIYCNYADAGQFENLGVTGGFVPSVVMQAVQISTMAASTPAPSFAGDITYTNKVIGTFKNIPVKSVGWCPEGYLFCTAVNDPRKPVVIRVPNNGEPVLRMGGQILTFPLQMDNYETEFGAGCFERSNGACLYIPSSSWVDYSGADYALA